MNYDISITRYDRYIHVRVSGRDSLEATTDMWRRIVKACESYDCFAVLGEQNMENPLEVIENYQIQDIFRKVGITSQYKIAWVDLNFKTLESTQFAETVLLNRGLVNGRLFTDVDKAKEWLFQTQ